MAEESTDEMTIDQEADLLLDIISEQPAVGVVMANALIAFGHALAAASERLRDDPDDTMAVAVFSIGSKLGLVDQSESDDEDTIVLVGSADLQDALQVIRETFASEVDLDLDDQPVETAGAA